MKYVDEFRDADLIRRSLREIQTLAEPGRHYRIMEVCGGHTHAIFRFGLAGLLPANVELIHGPGCPVCVLPMSRMDGGLNLANDPHVIFTTFGDMMRVPGSQGSPLECKARGADVRFVYSPLDALRLAKQNPEQKIVFFAIGFETTAPSTALTLLAARRDDVKNFFVYCNHVAIIPAMRAILAAPEVRIDGFIGPGHVSTVIGCSPFELVAREFNSPIVISGFEPLDILQSMAMVLRQLRDGCAKVQNQYARVVSWDGNPAALRAFNEVFAVRSEFEWRGMGRIARSAFQLRNEFAPWDAEQQMPAVGGTQADHPDAQCGLVLRGVLKPQQCRLFGKECTPDRPIGALMVSSEGACAAHHKYGFVEIEALT